MVRDLKRTVLAYRQQLHNNLRYRSLTPHDSTRLAVNLSRAQPLERSHVDGAHRVPRQ